MLARLVLVVLHPMNHHHTRLVLISQDLVLVMELLVWLKLVLAVLVHMNHHHTAHQ
jgi:hypothetical protein